MNRRNVLKVLGVGALAPMAFLKNIFKFGNKRISGDVESGQVLQMCWGVHLHPVHGRLPGVPPGVDIISPRGCILAGEIRDVAVEQPDQRCMLTGIDLPDKIYKSRQRLLNDGYRVVSGASDVIRGV